MQIDVMPIYTRVPSNHISNSTVIIVDVLRASSTIITAIKNGANSVIPTADPGQAASLSLKLGMDDCVLAGERDGLRLPDFALGNSPAEFDVRTVKDRNVIMSTTNGTVAVSSMSAAKTILVGAIINCSAVAKYAHALGDNVLIVCAGTYGRIGADDLCAAGAIATALNREAKGECEATDFTMVCCMLYADWKEGRADLTVTEHYSRLHRLGFDDDLKYCFTEDVTDVVPVCTGGVIKAG